jgi:hypothetical protein
MDLKVTGVVKYDGKWHKPGDVIKGVADADATEFISKGVGEPVPKSQAEIDADERAAKDAEAAVLVEAERLANEAKAVDAANKEAEKQLKALRKKATELGIEGAADKDAETLAAEIVAVDQK